MAINTVLVGQTFGNWLDATNQIVSEINGASSGGDPNKIVRYDASGGISLSSFSANTLTLQSGTTINAISNTISPTDNTTILTTSGIYNYVESKKDRIYNDLTANTTVVVNGTTATITAETVDVVEVTKDLVTISANTEFDQNVHITGNLTVDGDSVSIATTELTVEDKVVTFNKGDVFGADGAGFEIETGGSAIIASITYDLANSAFDLVTSGQDVKLIPATTGLVITLDQDLSTSANVQFEEIQANTKILVPSVTSTPLTGQAGQIHFNTTDTTFEGFDGTAWGSLGGVSTPDKSTKIVANNVSETLEFTANNSNVLNINEDSAGFLLDVSVAGNTALSGNLNVVGETVLHDDLTVNGDVTSNGSFVSVGSNIIYLQDWTLTFNQNIDGIEDDISTGTDNANTVPTSQAVSDLITSAVSGSNKINQGNTYVETTTNTIEFVANNVNVASYSSTAAGFLLDVSVAGNTALSGNLNVVGEAVLHDDLTANGEITSNSNIISLGTGAIVLPVGTDGDRLSQQGAIRYNTDQSSFEGYDGSNWGSLGGVSTPDKSTSIVANDTDKTLDFKANNNNVLVVTDSEFTFDSANVTSVSLFGETIDGIDVSSLGQSQTSIPSSNAVYEAIDNLDKISNGTTEIKTNSANATVKVSGSDVATFTANDITFEKDVIVFNANLTVLGTQTFVNTEILDVKDKNIKLNANGTSVTAQGAGIEVDATNAHIQLNTALDAWEVSTDDSAAKFTNPTSFTLQVGSADVMILDGSFVDFANTTDGVVLPTDDTATTPADGTIRYNATLDQFQGYSSSVWKGLGGVIDLNQDTKIEAHPTNDTLIFSANGNTILVADETSFTFDAANVVSVSLFGETIDGIDVTTLGQSQTSIPSSNAVYEAISVISGGLGSLDTTKISNGTTEVKTNTTDVTTTVSGNVVSTFTANSFVLSDNVASVTLFGNTINGIDVTTLSQSETSIPSSNAVYTLVAGLDATKIYNGTTEIATNSANATITISGTPIATFTDNEFTLNANLNVLGTQTVLDTQILTVEDNNILINKGGDTSTAVGAGIEVDATSAYFKLHTGLNSWDLAADDGVARIHNTSDFAVEIGASDVVTVDANTVSITTGQDSLGIDSGALVVTGGVGISEDLYVGSSITELSAAALKTQISPIENALDKVMKLQGVEFNWLNKEDKPREYGLIAENVAEVAPNLVSFVDEKAQGVKYSKMVSLLIEAVKEQQKEIETLKALVPKKRTKNNSK